MTTETKAAEIAGWAEYSKAIETLGAARDRYDRDSEHGYPAKAAKMVDAAEAVKATIAAQYPAAVAYALIDSYCYASNDTKVICGQDARKAVEGGADPIAVAAEMQSSWLQNAKRLVLNS